MREILFVFYNLSVMLILYFFYSDFRKFLVLFLDRNIVLNIVLEMSVFYFCD